MDGLNKDGQVTDDSKAGMQDGVVKAPDNEEPEPVLEADLPSDGRDEEGEAMIRDLRRTEPSPPKTEDENQPGFIGERNQPHT